MKTCLVLEENTLALEVKRPSNRCAQFLNVMADAVEHIEEYTIPQYGDYPDDQMTTWEDRDFIVQLRRYINRAESNARGEVEAQRDLLKIIHYAATLYYNRAKELKDVL